MNLTALASVVQAAILDEMQPDCGSLLDLAVDVPVCWMEPQERVQRTIDDRP